ncbi:integral membrane protein [Rutstroemia sp. NJR-2017a BVV2]|nr:integral membrane protein [Rutstroemia sp. NJR-2017a BVV2]
MPSYLRHLNSLTSVALLGLASLAVAHGDDESDMHMDMTAGSNSTVAVTDGEDMNNYFRYTQHGGLMATHIALMTIAWVFVLPICVMFSISRSRFTLLMQFAFLAINAAGVLCSTIYNANTPDLYPNNAHHKIGWLLTWICCAQVVIGVISAYAGHRDNKQKDSGYTPVSREAMAEHTRRLQRNDSRLSNDSGQGTEPNTESLRSGSSSVDGDEEITLNEPEKDDAEVEKIALMKGTKIDKYLSRRLPGLISARILRVFEFAYNVVDRLILLLGFVAFTTGIVTYGGLFKGDRVFSGLAHFIKGSVFFWYGILTLGRWAGCFAELGWSWNIKPTESRRFQPSAEFVESFLIFFYGATNVFLEHLAAWGSEWSAQDLEHLSITFMFIGGGLCGMFIESTKIRNFLNATVQNCSPEATFHPEAKEPKTYRFSMNPIPALVIMLLGMMMSSHHQHSMVSTMVHKQWGNLLVGAAFARAATYVVFYLSPPTSILPGRPPTELITAFALMAGGFVFMASAVDVVKSIELNGLDAMFVFTVSMGLITFLMAWVILVIAIKGWAVRKERRWGGGFVGDA